MVLLNEKQTLKLLKAVASTVPDELQCEDCFQLIAEYADAELRGVDVSQQLDAVRIHFSQCPCCAYEYASLLEAIQAAEE